MSLDSGSIRNYLSDRAGVSTTTLTDDAPLFSSGLVDSFSLVELIAYVEQQGGFRVDAWDVTLDNFDSINQILAYAATKKAGV